MIIPVARYRSFSPFIHKTPEWLINTIRKRIEGGSPEYLTQARQVLEKLQSQKLSKFQKNIIDSLLKRIDQKPSNTSVPSANKNTAISASDNTSMYSSRKIVKNPLFDSWGMNLKVFSNQRLASLWTCSD